MIIDSPVYAGGQTSFDAFSLGIPEVTHSGPLHIQNFATGIYRRMGLDDLPCQTIEQYVDLAVRLGTEPDYTVLSVAGRFPFEPEPRIKSAIAMSPSLPTATGATALLRRIQMPMLHLTGTKDNSPVRPEFKPIERRVPFDSINAPGQYLAIFNDGDHMLFSGHARAFGLSRLEQEYQPIIQELTLKFLDATLRKDADAEKWLNGSGVTELLGERATFERKEG